MTNGEPRLFDEKDLGIDQMVDDLMKSFALSCEHRGVGVDNLEYFRHYVFMLFAGFAKALERIENAKKPL